MSVDNGATRNLSDFRSSDADCVVDDSLLSVSQPDSAPSIDIVGSSDNHLDSTGAVSDSIAMSSRSVEDIFSPYSSSKSFTPDAGKIRSLTGNRGLSVGSRDKSQQQTPVTIPIHSIAQYFTRKNSVEKTKKAAITTDREEAPIAKTCRSETSMEKEIEKTREPAATDTSNSKLQTVESEEKFSSPNIIEETPLEEIAKYSGNGISLNPGIRTSENILLTKETVPNQVVEYFSTNLQQKTLEKDTVSIKTVEETGKDVDLVEESSPIQLLKDVLTPIRGTAGSVSTTPKSASLSTKLGTPGILKKIDSPANPDKKNLRVHFVPDEAEVKQIAAIDQITSPTRKSVRKISLPTQSNEGNVQNRKRPWENDQDVISLKENEVSVSAPLIPLLEMEKSSPEKIALACLSTNVPSSPRCTLIKKSKLRSVSSLKSSSSTTTSVPAVKEIAVPFMPELINNEEARNQGINQLCRTLAPGGTSTLVMHLHSKKVLTVGAFASLSETEILALPIRMPQKLEKVRELLCKLYLGQSPAVNKSQPKATAPIPEIVEDILINEKENDENAGVSVVEEGPASEPPEDSMDVDIFTSVAANLPTENVAIVSEVMVQESQTKQTNPFSKDIKMIWSELKTTLSWADDPSVTFQQSSVLEMLMALAAASKNISERMYGEISQKSVV